jgi:alpha-L-rhamnosidase
VQVFWLAAGVIAVLKTVDRLRCEYLEDPLGLDVAQPRFSWVFSSPVRGERQRAYQVLVASNRDMLNSDAADMWDSGIVESDACAHVIYKGKALESGRRYYWKVRVFNAANRSSEWSRIASFQMGLPRESDWTAQWIAAGGEGGPKNGGASPAPLFRKEFHLDREVKEAYAYVSGLGYYELYINGARIGDRVLDPATTEYSRRVLYSTYDVTESLTVGDNAIGVMLGNGWFAPPWQKARKYAASPQLLFQLSVLFSDGSTQTIVSDHTWRASDGPVTGNSVFDGEEYDARFEQPGWCNVGFDDSGWASVREVEGPGGVLDSQLMPSMKVTRTIEPVAMSNPRAGVYVFDMGQNFAGWARLRIRGASSGTKIVLRYAELVGEGGLVDTRSLRNAKATDTYIAREGEEQVYEPRFTYHGFRYVQVEGYPGEPTVSDVQGRVVHTAVEPTGHFSCSSALLNQIHSNTWWSYVSNLLGIPTDCPQRDERLGWTGDAHLAAELGMANFYSAPFYVKWLEDVADAQLTTVHGGVPDLVPFHLSGFGKYPPGPPGWSSAYLFVVWYMYLYFEDLSILERHYEGIRSWFECFKLHCDSDCTVSWARGDWAIPSTYEANEESKKVTSTSLLYMSASLLSRIAGILGRQEDAAEYAEFAKKVQEGFCRRLLAADSGKCGSGTQTENLFPLYAGIVPGELYNSILRSAVDSIIQSDYHLDVGILGMKAAVNVLPECGMADVLHRVVRRTTYPSYGYMVKNRATTLWETFDGGIGVPSAPSLNHVMFGTIDEYFYKYLAGIRPPAPQLAPEGHRLFTIKPFIPDDPDLTWVKASVMTARGKLSSSWNRSEDELSVGVAIPTGSTAIVHIPLQRSVDPVVYEGGTVVFSDCAFKPGAEGIQRAYCRDGCVVLEIAAGSYAFKMRTGCPKREDNDPVPETEGP